MRLLSSTFLLFIALFPARSAATSQWTRKYGVSCTSCHTAAFPRLNYHGERFMRNGYQDPGTEDGDTVGKTAIRDRTFIDEVGNFLGVRLNLTPLSVTTNDVEVTPGEPTTRVDVGGTNWFQLFTAGSIFKNVSVFIETEIPFDGKVHHSWFRVGLHNLLGTKALNTWIGVMDPLELHAVSGRLPMIPPVRHEAFFVKSSDGLGEQSLSSRGGRPALALYGSAGPLVYEVGIDNGPSLKDIDGTKNVWATLRGELTEGALEGSSVSVFATSGLDSKKLKDAGGAYAGQVRNDYWRISPAANLRLKDLDVLIAGIHGHDDNWTLNPAAAYPTTFQGLFLQAGHPIGDALHLAAQFDRVWSEVKALEFQKPSLALTYLPRENWRFILVGRADALPISAVHKVRKHEFLISIRTMF
jgi:hypothetical protein